MFEAEYLLFVERVERDGTGKANLIGVHDYLFSESFPNTIPQVNLVFKLVPVDGPVVNKSLTVKLQVKKDGKVIGETTGTNTVTVEKDTGLVSPTSIKNIVFPEPGDYSFILSVNGKRVIERKYHLRPASELSEA